MRSSAAAATALAILGAISAACGQKGPPLAPLHLVPAAVTDVSLRRVGDRARLRFVLPTRNANGPGRLELDRVEIFAVTVGPGAPPPPNRDLLSKAYLVGQIAVRPVPLEGQAPVEDDKRPEPGTSVTFDEELTEATLKPAITKPAEQPKEPTTPAAGATAPPAARTPTEPAPGTPTAPAPGTPTPPAPGTTPPPTTAGATAAPGPGTTAAPGPGTTAAPGPGTTAAPAAGPTAAPAAPVSTDPARVYAVVGVTRSGRRGPPSARAQIPLVTPPPAPAELTARFTETRVVVEWKPPSDTVTAYNVYGGDDPMQPLNPEPVTSPSYERAFSKFGEAQCFRVRSVTLAGAVSIEGERSPEQCVTPVDTFPPAAPAGLALVPTAGQISLIWDANTEKDLAGYLVLRGEAPNGPLQPITPAPIREASFRDTTAIAGTRYIYAIVAVDAASPANRSAESPRVEETAR